MSPNLNFLFVSACEKRACSYFNVSNFKKFKISHSKVFLDTNTLKANIYLYIYI